MKNREIVLLVLAVCVLAIGIVSYFTYQTDASQLQPPALYYT